MTITTESFLEQVMNTEWDRNFGSLIHRNDRALLRLLENTIKKYDLSVGMFHFLRVLWQQDGLSQKALGEAAGLRSSTTAAALDQMEKKALILRQKNKTDRRIYNIFLTQAGLDLEQQVLPEIKKLNTLVLKKLTTQEQEQLLDLLTKATDSVEDAEKSLA